MTFGKEMKTRQIKLLRIFLIAIVLFIGVGTYRNTTQLDLRSGLLRTQLRSFGLPIYTSSPQNTALSEALQIIPEHSDWFTVAEREFAVIPIRISFCYPKLLSYVRRVDRGFGRPEAAKFLASAVLQELDLERDICDTTNHMSRVFEALIYEEDSDSASNNAEELWKTTKKPNKSEQATPRKPSD